MMMTKTIRRTEGIDLKWKCYGLYCLVRLWDAASYSYVVLCIIDLLLQTHPQLKLMSCSPSSHIFQLLTSCDFIPLFFLFCGILSFLVKSHPKLPLCTAISIQILCLVMHKHKQKNRTNKKQQQHLLISSSVVFAWHPCEPTRLFVMLYRTFTRVRLGSSEVRAAPVLAIHHHYSGDGGHAVNAERYYRILVSWCC